MTVPREAEVQREFPDRTDYAKMIADMVPPIAVAAIHIAAEVSLFGDGDEDPEFWYGRAVYVRCLDSEWRLCRVVRYEGDGQIFVLCHDTDKLVVPRSDLRLTHPHADIPCPQHPRREAGNA